LTRRIRTEGEKKGAAEPGKLGEMLMNQKRGGRRPKTERQMREILRGKDVRKKEREEAALGRQNSGKVTTHREGLHTNLREV